jgi:hypothetical protein
LAGERRKTLRETAILEGMLTAEEFDEWVSAEAVCRLGSPSLQGIETDEPTHSERT